MRFFTKCIEDVIAASWGEVFSFWNFGLNIGN